MTQYCQNMEFNSAIT